MEVLDGLVQLEVDLVLPLYYLVHDQLSQSANLQFLVTEGQKVLFPYDLLQAEVLVVYTSH